MITPLDELGSNYAEAWDEWESDPEHLLWESVAADGVGDNDPSS